jgi:hypothetical protein
MHSAQLDAACDGRPNGDDGLSGDEIPNDASSTDAAPTDAVTTGDDGGNCIDDDGMSGDGGHIQPVQSHRPGPCHQQSP